MHRALYAAFDRFPSRKGSAVHIDRFSRALFEHAGGGLLYALGGEDLPAYQREGDVEIVRYMRQAGNVLERAEGFAARLDALLDRLAPTLRIAHFRDPWGGLPIVEPICRAYDERLRVEQIPGFHMEIIEGRFSDARQTPLLRIRGPLRSLLSADRVILNFLQHLSGIATKTNRFVKR